MMTSISHRRLYERIQKIFMYKIRLLSFAIFGIVMLLLPERSFAVTTQPSDTVSVSFLFRFDNSMLMPNYNDNQSSLLKLSECFTPSKVEQIKKIIIEGGYSPGGTKVYNTNLAMKRAASVENYISDTYPHNNKIEINKIIQDSLMRSVVLCYVVMKPQHKPTREELKPTIPVTIDTIVQKIAPSEVAQLESAQTEVAQPDTVATVEVAVLQQPEQPVMQQEYTRKPLFALKTNMLFDAASLLNIEVEVPIGQRFSVAGEWIFPWWLFDNKQHCLQMLSGNIEGKYWFGNREKREVMTGWHAGLYAGGGYYDLEWNKVGFQGEFFIAAGISGGYAHRIGKNLRLEYSLGIGFMQTNYRKYDAKQDADGDWNLYRNSTGRYTWIGPTRARISLVWMINGKKKGGVR